MKTFEISGKLKHIDNFKIFSSTINEVWDIFVDAFGAEVMKKI